MPSVSFLPSTVRRCLHCIPSHCAYRRPPNAQAKRGMTGDASPPALWGRRIRHLPCGGAFFAPSIHEAVHQERGERHAADAAATAHTLRRWPPAPASAQGRKRECGNRVAGASRGHVPCAKRREDAVMIESVAERAPQLRKSLHSDPIYRWVTTTDHKRIGLMYMYTAFIYS